MPNFYKQLVWGALYDFLDFQKGTFGDHCRQQRLPKWSAPNSPGPPWTDPGFHETKVIIVPLGPNYWFLKGRLLPQDWLIFGLFCFSLCYVLYNMFITF